MQDIINNFNSLSSQLQAMITIVAILIVGFLILKAIQAITYIFIHLPEALENFKKFIIKLFKILTYPLKLIWKSLVWLFTIKKRHDYRESVIHSIYAIDFDACHPGFFRRFFSRKIRREAKWKFNAIEDSIDTKEKISNYVKTNNFVSGKVGAGKSSFLSALTHIKVIIHQENINEKINNTKKILYTLNYYDLDNLINSSYRKNKYIPDILNLIYKDDEFNNYLFGEYDNYRQTTPKTSLIKDYVTAYCAFLRNNYVMSNFPLYNRITNTFNIKLTDDFFHIKDEKLQKKYYIPAYLSIVEDELALGDQKNTVSTYNLDNSGRDTAMRLFRQLKNETTDWTGASQNSTRVQKGTRELGNTFFMIESRRVIGAQKRFSLIFKNKEDKLIKKMKKTASKMEEKEAEIYLNSNNEFKKKIYDLYQFQNRIYASSFIEYKVRITHSEKDLERWDTANLPLVKLVFPLTWCYGTYRTCQHADLDEKLNEASHHSDDDLRYIKDFYDNETDYDEILKSRDKRRDEKEQAEEEAKNRKRKEKEKKKKEGEAS